MSQGSRLILPSNVHEQVSPQPPRRPPLRLPKEVIEEVNSHLQDIPTLDTLLEKFLSSDPGKIAMMQSKVLRALVQDYITVLLPQAAVELCKKDRTQLLETMKSVGQDRITRSMMKKEVLDAASYNAAVGDFFSIASQLPVPSVNLQIQDIPYEEISQDNPNPEI
jgi:hypothetical protein